MAHAQIRNWLTLFKDIILNHEGPIEEAGDVGEESEATISIATKLLS